MTTKEEIQPQDAQAVPATDSVKAEIVEEMPPIEELAEEVPAEEIPPLKKSSFDKEAWTPKTDLGKKVKEGKITTIDQILDSGQKIMESEIIDVLLPGWEVDLLLVGQSRGKFGGGQRRVFKQVQKKTKEGNKPHFACYAVVGNKDGYVGVGYGKAKETVPSREKSVRKAKLNIIKIRRGCGSWQCGCKDAHTIPLKTEGKCGSVRITLMPAPKGTGLCAESEVGKILAIAGVQDVWSKTAGQSNTRGNLILATFDALQNLMTLKINSKDHEALNIREGTNVSAKNDNAGETSP